MKTSALFLFIILLLSVHNSFGQKNKPNEEREKFISDYSRTMEAGRAKEIKDFIDNELSPMLLGGNFFPEERFQQMQTTVDQLNEKQITPFPHLHNYVVSVYSLVKRGKTGIQFDNWHNIVDDLIKNRNTRRLEEFLAVSRSFLYQNIIAEDPNFTWYLSGNEFEFINDKTPQLRVENTTIVCKTINRASNWKDVSFTDSVKIENTSGIADLSSNKWEGQGGQFTWEKALLPKNETVATLNNYSVSFRSTNFTVDSVSLKTPYISRPVPGRIIDRAVKGNYRENRDMVYPQFSSYQANFEIKNIIEDVDYKGGFSLNGDQFVGVGNDEMQAELIYYRKSKPFIITQSDQVRVSSKSVRTDMAKMTMFIGLRDSITHTGLNVSYNQETESLKMTRGSAAISQAPFINSFHKMNMYVDELIWNKNSNDLVLGYDINTSEQQRNARFESFSYYDERLYQRLQGVEALHPLVALYKYAYKYDKFNMDEGTAATALNRTIEQAKPKLLELSALGFISYDTDRETVVVNPKTEHFVKSKSRASDYDNISFTSNLSPIRSEQGNTDQDYLEKVRKRNLERSQINQYGKMDLSSLDMDIQAVDFIKIADIKRTTIFPDSNQVVIKKNRNIVFSGWINSGKWEVKIEKGDYVYESNKFNVYDSKVAYFNANPLRAEDGKRAIPLQSVLNGLQGEIIVDATSNRSGLNEGFDEYPILVSKEKTRVYYDQKQLHRGAYNKERFYFEVDPFTLDSLLTFNERNLRFPGELTSAGIFPKMRDELKVMADYSLGFSQDVPSEGYEFYGTDAIYENKILLSNNGLQGGGTINFINSSSTSKSLFTFLPDSAIGVATFINRPQEAGVEYPDADGPDAFITFLPREKQLKARSNKEDIAFFNGEAKLEGSTVLNHQGMTGRGGLDLSSAKLRSRHFDFTRWVAETDTASFLLNNKYKKEGDLTEDALAFKTDNVNGKLDFKERVGIFRPNKGISIVEFPVNQYICKIDQFTWQMDQDEMTLEKKEQDNLAIESGMDLDGPNFFSTNPKQDSLQFLSPKAKFSLKERTIYAYDTEFLEIADARIFPDSAVVVVRKNAKLDKFENAKIVANFITKYHSMVNVEAEVTARRAYTAIGDYEYGREGEEKQLIHLSEIRLDTSFQTVAVGAVDQENILALSEQFSFYGDVRLKAADPYLLFKGATKVNHDCKNFERSWMAFETAIDPEKIQIPVGEDMVDLEGNKITVGIRWRNSTNKEEVRLYPTFLSQVLGEEDPEVFSASGLLQYNGSTKEYQISNKEKLVNRNEKGNYISLHTETCSLNGDGDINLGMDFGTLDVTSIGEVNYDEASEQTDLKLTMAIRAPVETKAFRDIGAKIIEVPGLKDTDFNNSTLEQALVEWVNRKSADKIKSDFTLKKEFKNVPKELEDAIVITGIELTSYAKPGDNQKGLLTTSTQSAIVNIFNQPVMKYVSTRIFAEQRSNMGDRLGLFLNVPGGFEYFIDYDYRKDGVMNILTDDKDFNTEVSELKADKKKSRKFIYDITQNSAYKSQFLRVFN
ncbi:hypothetical protein [Brumimicrobium oceani]|uniref:Cell surface protein SprA n=1 Tax=Brumimicrobium oceani TaxID=2100725 RepID=A0A2U2X0Y0_9FLAO|nr:hypothetical protein [Brumimicrobium oceani]PWH81445.1 hypothetical protein DIT68_15035 [Brumimicrobium oceani]